MSITYIGSAVILWCIQYSLGLYQECYIRGQQGSCQHIEDCPSVINSIVHNENPQICYSRGSDLEVCCLNFYRRDPHQRGHPRSNRRPHRRRFGPPRPYPFNPNELPTTYFPFQTSTSVPDNRGTKTSNQDPVKSVLQERKPDNRNLEEVTSISLKKCLKYYPVPRFPTFVAGGEKSLPKQYPHMALIGFGDDENDKQWLCGGSLISKKFILTAGHCLFSNEHGLAKWVHLGDLDLSTDSDDASPQDFNIKRRIQFPDYRPPQKYHDIALLELEKEVTFSPYVSPACLQTTKEINDTSMIATGWGKTDFAADASSFLMHVDLNEMGIEDCQKYFGADENYLPNGVVDELQICAGGVKGKDTCGGDSGGPLQIKNQFRSFIVKVSTVVGITSFGKACGLTPAPGIYTRVSYYRRWIESIVWDNDQD